jgi:WD40 repeat protein
MLAIGTEGTIELWEVATGELKKETGGHYGWVSCVALSAGARRVASGGLHDYVLALRETGRTAEIIHETGVSYPSALAFSADDRMLVSGDDDGLLRVWNAETGELVAWLPCRFRVVTCRFSPDGRSIWAADTGGSARRPNLYVLELCDFWSAPLAAPCSTLEPGAG